MVLSWLCRVCCSERKTAAEMRPLQKNGPQRSRSYSDSVVQDLQFSPRLPETKERSKSVPAKRTLWVSVNDSPRESVKIFENDCRIDIEYPRDRIKGVWLNYSELCEL